MKKFNNFFKYLCVSYGGSGAHMLLNIMKNNPIIDTGCFEQHHIRKPPKTFSEPVKVVYIFGDPYNAILSYFRRRKEQRKTWVKEHCKNIRGEYKKINENWDLLDYLKNGEDLFKLEEHFDNWTNIKEKDYQVAVLKYESTSIYIKDLLDFIDMDPSKSDKFEFKKRKSDWRNQPKEVKDLLEKMYGGFYEKYKNYPGFKIL